MDDIRREIELKLCGNLLRDWCRLLCESTSTVEFEDAWCSGYTSIRFSTEMLQKLVEGSRGKGDCWGLGRAALYEIESSDKLLSLRLLVSPGALKKALRVRIDRLADSLAEAGLRRIEPESDPIVLAEWPLAVGKCSGNDAVSLLDEAWRTDVAFFEKSLSAWLAGDAHATWRIPESKRKVLDTDELPDTVFVEGAQVTILTDRYERSREARRHCIAVHGTACAVCGVDFGTLYGAQFAGKIEVHHKKPLSEIREDYVVDPVNDLVPVCPNCHMVLHSKPGKEPYTVEEVRSMLKSEGRGV